MTHFDSVFPEVAARETRSLYLPEGYKRLPSAQYGFLELYCDDPGCDCRRVLLQVCREDDPDKVLTTITYGWETESFYARLLRGDRKTAREMTGASLDPYNKQSKYSEDLLELFREVVLSDKDYVERLQRHYRMFKKALRKQAHAKRSSSAS
jgi:hypothetical protein